MSWVVGWGADARVPVIPPFPPSPRRPPLHAGIRLRVGGSAARPHRAGLGRRCPHRHSRRTLSPVRSSGAAVAVAAAATEEATPCRRAPRITGGGTRWAVARGGGGWREGRVGWRSQGWGRADGGGEGGGGRGADEAAAPLGALSLRVTGIVVFLRVGTSSALSPLRGQEGWGQPGSARAAARCPVWSQGTALPGGARAPVFRRAHAHPPTPASSPRHHFPPLRSSSPLPLS